MLILFFKSAKEMLEQGVIGLFLTIDSVLYKVVGDIYKIFMSLSKAQLLNNDIYEAIANRIYLFIGIIALFVMTFNLLKGLIDPDSLSKGIISSFKNLVISIILLVLMPTIFTYAYSLQAAILGDNLIGRFFDIDVQKTNSKTQSVTVEDLCSVGNKSAEVAGKNKKYNTNSSSSITKSECEGNFLIESIMEAFFTPYDDNVKNEYDTVWSEARKYMVYTGNFTYINTYVENVKNDEETQSISYKIIISAIAAVAIGYLFLTFAIDIGIRAFKLAFYQLIAPIPIMFKIVPGQEGKFTKWYQQAIQCYLEVFVRLLIISFVFFMCKNLFAIVDSIIDNGMREVGLLGKAILAMGLFAFGKQAPKLFQDALGISGGNVKLGIRGKLAEGGALAAGAAIGSAATSASRNMFAAGQEAKNNIGNKMQDFRNQSFKDKVKSLGSSAASIIKVPASTIGGMGSGFLKGGKAGWGAKNEKDMVNAISQGASENDAKRLQKKSYKASHPGIFGVPAGHVKDMVSSAGEFMGIDSLASLKQSQEKINEVDSATKGVKDAVDAVMNRERLDRSFWGTTLAELENGLESLKSSGASAEDITAQETIIKEWKNEVSKQILKGVNKDGNQDVEGMDIGVKTAMSKYQTVAKHNISYIKENANLNNADVAAGYEKFESIVHNNKSLDDFITDGDAINILDSQTKKTINSSKGNVDIKMAQHMQKKELDKK